MDGLGSWPGGRAPDYWNVGGTMPEYLSAYEGAALPVPSTIPELDDALKGGFRPGVHFIGGNTGAGKSSFCIWLAERMAQAVDPATGKPYGVTYVSLELGMPEVRARMGSRLSLAVDGLVPWRWAEFEELGVNAREHIRAGDFDPTSDPVYLSDLFLMERCPNLRIVDNIAHRSANYLESVTGEIAHTGSSGGRVLFLDYLQCVDSGEGLDETESMKRAVREINLSGIRAGVAVIVISAVSRAKGTEMRKGKSDENPGADIFRGSSWIEYTGLSAFALVRREGSMERDGEVEVELWPVKNRRGRLTGPVHLMYAGAYGEWRWE